MQIPSPGWQDPLEKEMATHSSTLAWKIAWAEKQRVHGVPKSRTQLSMHTCMHAHTRAYTHTHTHTHTQKHTQIVDNKKKKNVTMC